MGVAALCSTGRARNRSPEMNALVQEESGMLAEVKSGLSDTERGVLSDSELADAIASGDQGAFRTLMRRYNRLLYRTARSILKDETDAEDALQNAYLSVYRAIGK